DGKTDVCGRAGNGIVCELSDGVELTSLPTWTTYFSDGGGFEANESYWGTIHFPDLKGDGKADVCARAAPGVFCGLSNGTSFDTVTKWDSYYADSGVWDEDPKYWSTIQFPDINGDGKADICGRAPNGVVCELSDGTKFTNLLTWTTTF